MRGSGLGLAIAQSLVDLHGGTMRIRSQPGAGTMVLVHLPNTRMPHVKALPPKSAAGLQIAASEPTPMAARSPRFAPQLVEGHMPGKHAAKVSRIA